MVKVTVLLVFASLAITTATVSTPHAQPFDSWGHGSGWGWQSGPGYGPGRGYGWRNPHAPGRGRFAMIDANDDGVVSAEEAASNADAVFTAMDADDDGALTKEEFMTVRMGPQHGFNPTRQQAMQVRKEARFDDMDDDKDGKVLKAEFLVAAKDHHLAADIDSDGKVTPWEHRSRNWN